MSFFLDAKRLSVAIFGVCAGAFPALAQVDSSSLRYTGRADTIPFAVDYAQGAFNTGAYREALDPSSLIRQMADRIRPKDSVNQVVGQRATAWMRRLSSQRPATGMELDPYASLLVEQGRVDDARRVIAERFATPGLSVGDKIYTLSNAFLLFANPRRADRLDIAEQYLEQLKTLGPEAQSQYMAECKTLAFLFYSRGHDEKSLQYFRMILNQIPLLPIKKREFNSMMIVADLLINKPGGHEELKRYNQMLIAVNTPTSAEIAADSGIIMTTGFRRMQAQQDQTTIDEIGRILPPVYGDAWLNHPQKGKWSQPLNDGKIRFIEFGEIGCEACVMALPMMKRIAAKFANVPNVEAMYATTTTGVWAARAVTPVEEVQGMNEYYVQRRKITFPISIWAPGRALDKDGNMTVPESETYKTFHVVGTPRFILVDGQGRLRRVFDGYGRMLDEQFETAIQRLITERTQASSTVQ